MLPNVTPAVVALAAAYCALAAPTNTQPDYVREVIDALKAHLEAENISDASTVFSDAETSLRADNLLNDAVVANLKHQIQILTTEKGITVDTIAEETVEYLNAKGAFKKSDQGGAIDGAIFLDTEVIKQVVHHGINFYTCPDGSQAKLCGGCIIL